MTNMPGRVIIFVTCVLLTILALFKLIPFYAGLRVSHKTTLNMKKAPFLRVFRVFSGLSCLLLSRITPVYFTGFVGVFVTYVILTFLA